MRPQVPTPVPQNPPTNPRGSLAARWYESVSSQQQQQQRPKERDNYNESTTKKDQNNKLKNQQQRRSLGDMFLENQMLMDQTMTEEEAIAALVAARNNIRTPSITSTADIERARRTMDNHRQKSNRNENRNDYEATRTTSSTNSKTLSVWPPPEHEPFTQYLDNNQEPIQVFINPMKEQQREEAPPPVSFDSFEQQENSNHRPHNYTSAFNTIRPLRQKSRSGIKPTPALADAAEESVTTSPPHQLDSTRKHNSFHDGRSRHVGQSLGERGSHQYTARQQQHKESPHGDPMSQHQRRRSMPSEPPLPAHNNYNNTGGIISQMPSALGSINLSETNSIADSEQYYDHHQPMVTTGNPVFNFLQNACGPTLKSPWDTNQGNHNKDEQRKTVWSYLGDIDPNGDLEEYDDLSLTSSEERIVHDKGYPSKVSSTGRRKETSSVNKPLSPTSRNDRQSPTRKPTKEAIPFEIAPLKYNRNVPPARESMHTNPAERRETSRRKGSPDPRMRTSRESLDGDKKQRSSPRFKVTVTSNVQHQQHRNATTTPRGGPNRHQPVDQREPSSDTRPPHAATRDGYETTAAFASRNRQKQQQKTTRRSVLQNPKIPPPNLENTNVSNGRTPQDNHEVKSEVDRNNAFQFTTDFLDCPAGLSSQNMFPTGNTAEDDIDDNDVRRLNEKLIQVRNKSIKNMKKLQQIQHASENRVSGHQRGTPKQSSQKQDSWAVFDDTSDAAVFDPFRSDTGRQGSATSKHQPQQHLNNQFAVISSASSSWDASFSSSDSPIHRGRAKRKGLGGKQKNGQVKTEEASKAFEGHYMYVAYSRFGDDPKEVLQLCEHQCLPVANSKNNEVLIKVQSGCVSATDCEIRRGEWEDVCLSPYLIPGTTFVGTIDTSEKRSTFSAFKPGDTVVSLVKFGANARYMAVSKQELVKVPRGIDPDLAACLPETYLTAFQILHLNHRNGSRRYRNDSLKGQSILIMHGHTSLGRAIIELSLAAGAEFCYALVKSKQAPSISKLGGIPLSKDPQDWLTLIGRQVHLMVTVIDDIHADHVTKDHLKALNDKGEVVIVGQRRVDNSDNILPNEPPPSGIRLICKPQKKRNRSKSYNVFDSWELDTKQGKRDLEHLLSLLEHGRLNPEVLDRIPLSKTAKAQAIVGNKKLSGHIVCKPWLPQSYVPAE